MTRKRAVLTPMHVRRRWNARNMFGPQKVNNAVVSAEQNHISSFYADAATCSLPERSELNIALVVCIAVTCDEDAARAVVGESLPEPSLMWSPPPLPPFDEKDADDELREDDDADGESATNWSRRARDEPVLQRDITRGKQERIDFRASKHE